MTPGRWPRWRIFRLMPGVWRIVHEHEPGTIPPRDCNDCWRNYQALSGAQALAVFRGDHRTLLARCT